MRSLVFRASLLMLVLLFVMAMAGCGAISAKPSAGATGGTTGGTTAGSGAVSLSPANVNFGSVQIGTSGTQSVSLTNSGNGALTISSITATGAGFSQTNNCGASLNAGASCAVTVNFAATQAGSASGALTVVSNAAGSPNTVTLAATATVAPAPAVSLSPASLNFGSVNVGATSAALSVTLTNSGNASLTVASIAASAGFAQTNNCGATVSAGASCTINVAFTPTAAGAVSGTLTVTSNAGSSPNTVALSGTGASSGTPAVTLNPTNLDFGSVNVGSTSSALTASLTNSGNATLTISSVTISASFGQTNTCGTSVNAGATCTFTVRFSPGTVGVITGALNIASNAGNNSISLTGTGVSTPGGGGTGLDQVKHIIFMLQENRSVDTYFAKMNDYRVSLGLTPDFDDLPPDANSLAVDATQTVGAFHLKTMCIENTSPDWHGSHNDFNPYDPTSDVPTMNGWVETAAGSAIFQGSQDVQGLRVMGYYDANDLPYHYFLAAMFGTSDRWFAPAPTATTPNRLYSVGATSAGHAHFTGAPQLPIIFSLLQDRGISWKVYESDPGNSIVRAYQPFATTYADHIVNISQYFTDIQNGTLPAVALIEREAGRDEHPGGSGPADATYSVQFGTWWTSQLINPLIQSSSWQDSVFILTFDEGGGLYDHVPPPTNVPNPDGIKPVDLFVDDPPGDFTRYGFRVPLMVVSPFSKPHYVSHTVTDYTAILKFIETRFGLPSMTKRDAVASDMLEYFDFVNAPWKVPPTIPVQPTNGPCYDGLP